MNYVMDTNILLYYLKNGREKQFVEDTFDPFGADNTAIVSVVSIAELGVLARRNNWGQKRLAVVQKLYRRLLIVDISSPEIVEAYIDIDTYSSGKHPTLTFQESARNMGKNDVWIAATALVADAQLITSDKDFLHLDGVLLDVKLVERQHPQ